MDYKFWLPIALSVAVPAAGFYATIKIMDYRVGQLEAHSDAEEWGEYKQRVQSLEAQVKSQWRLLRER